MIYKFHIIKTFIISYGSLKDSSQSQTSFENYNAYFLKWDQWKMDFLGSCKMAAVLGDYLGQTLSLLSASTLISNIAI